MRTVAIAALLFQLHPAPDALCPVDDQGLEIRSPLRVCFGVESGETCVDKPPYERPPGTLKWVFIEGPLHGPVTIEPPPAGARVVVPRKANLRIAAPGAPVPLTATLYDLRDQRLRQPRLSLPVPSRGDLAIPGGQWLLSVTTPGLAPDLHPIKALPGQLVQISATPRRGFSVVVICTMPDGEQHNVRASSTLVNVVAPSEHPGADPDVIRRGTTNEMGVVTFSGIEQPLVALEARRPGFVPTRVGGVSATSATFAVREVSLEKGGTLRVSVLDGGGRGVPGTCDLYEAVPTVTVDPRPILKKIVDSVVPEKGICVMGPARPGDAVFRFHGVDGKRYDEAVTIVSGQSTELSVRWSELTLHGAVTRGGTPVPGAIIKVLRDGAGLPKDEDACSTGTSDDEGQYRVRLAQEGRYRALLTLTTVPVAMEVVEIHAAERELNFTLNPASVDGTVVDQAGNPVANAIVSLSLAGGYRSQRSTTNGTFSFPVSTNGNGFVVASKPGYERSPQVDFVLGDTPLAPVQLIVKRRDSLLGRLLRADNSPAAGVPLLSVDPVSGAILQVGESAADGTFELARAAGSATRILTAGSTCGLCARTLFVSEDAPVDVVCPSVLGTLDLTLQDQDGKALSRESILLAIGGAVFPARLLQLHLSALGISALTDASGRISLAGLDPGRVAAYLARAASERSIASGMPTGYLVAVELAPGETSEHVVTVRLGPASP